MQAAVIIIIMAFAFGFFAGFGAIFGMVAAGRWLALKDFFKDGG